MRTLWYFFRKAPERAGRSAWYDRRVRNAEAAGSNPARSIMRLEPNRDCVKTRLSFRKMLFLYEKCWWQDAAYTRRAQLFEHGLSFHTG